MKLYSAKVRLAGSLLNEAIIHDRTAAEIALLRVLHGSESVVDIKQTGNVNRSDKRERERLAGIYSYRDQVGPLDGPNLVLKYLGAPGVPLPQEVETVEIVEDEPEVIESNEDEKIEQLAEPVVVTAVRSTKGKKPAEVQAEHLVA